MDPNGNIRLLTEKEPLRSDEVLLDQRLKDYLEQYEAKDRAIILKGLTSKNKSSQKRANKKIAKASRQKNRRLS